MSVRFAQLALIVPLAAALVAAAPAAAAEEEGVSRTVSYADLDLTTDAGAKRLKQRVDRAAVAVCGGSHRLPLGLAQEHRECRTAAIASAEPQMQILFAQAQDGRQYADAGTALTVSAH